MESDASDTATLATDPNAPAGNTPPSTDEVDTRALGPRDTVRQTDRGSSRTHAPVRTPQDAMRLEEVRRTKIFVGFVAILTLFAGPFAVLLGGDVFARRVLYVGVAITHVASLVTLWIIRDPNRYTPRVSTVYGYFAVIGMLSAFYFFGVHSGAVLLVPIGAYFFALNQSFAGALSILLLCIVPHAVLSALFITGHLEDRGVIQPVDDLDAFARAGVIVLLQFIFVSAFVMARGVRRGSQDALEQLDMAARDVAQREALLNEAKQDLALVLKVGGPGRYTDHNIGSFKVGHVIGRGAMGEVYEGIDPSTGRLAAIKLLSVEGLAKPENLKRFVREVQAVASLNNEHVVRVLETPDPGDPIPFLAMERLHGESLADLLRREPRMRPPQVAAMVRQLADGIAAAHAAGIVHRDLKPRNIFRHWSEGGGAVWKILDFGVSKLEHNSDTLTRGNVIGTPAYMAPEQARGDQVDARSDLYALGLLAYRCVTGRPAFSGTDIPVLLHAVVYDTPPAPSSVATIPSAFDSVLAVATAKDPAARFQTAAELANAVEAAARGVVPAGVALRAKSILAERPWGVSTS